QFRLYILNPQTGAASIVSPAPLGVFPGTVFAIDFDPQFGMLRLVSDAEVNVRINPDTGLLAGTDTPIAPDVNIAGIAYTASISGASSSTLYAIDAVQDALFRIGGPGGLPTPNNGGLTLIGQLGLDISSEVGFDIEPIAGTNTVWAIFTSGGVTKEYTI